MTDMDTALRTMLRERASEITSVPEHIIELHDGPRRHDRGHRTGWLVAASIVAVLLVVGTIVALGSGSGQRHGNPAVSHQPTPTAPAPTAPHIRRQVALNWIGMAALPGFTQHLRESRPGYRLLAVRMNNDSGTPVGCNGCENTSDDIYVYDRGVFDPVKQKVSTWKRVTVNGTTGYLGSSPWQESTTHSVPTVAWQFRPNEWAAVQGVTDAGGLESTLLKVARAVRPTVDVPITLPMTFTYLPDLPIMDITDDRSEGYAFMITFGDVTARSFSLTLWDGAKWNYFDPGNATPRSVGGLPGFISTGQGVGILFAGGGAAFGFGQGDDPATDRRELDKIVTGLRWANGDGRTPWIPAERAIP